MTRIRTVKFAAVLAAMTLSANLAPAGAGEPRVPSCTSETHHQLDFWIGDWLVLHADGKRAGENRIVSVAGGCALFESWTGEGGVSGHSLTFYDGAQRKWRQHWIDNTGAPLDLSGSKVGRSILLLGETQELAGKSLQRLTFTPAEDGSVRQLWESSPDGGKTWKTEFDGRYVRKK